MIAFKLREIVGHVRVLHRFAGKVRQQVLLRDIGNVVAGLVLGEEMVERLILAGPQFLRDRKPPLLGVGENRIDVEDHPPERVDAMLDDLADREFCLRTKHVFNSPSAIPLPRGWTPSLVS